MHTVKALIVLATFFISKYFKKIALLFDTDTEKKRLVSYVKYFHLYQVK